MKIIVFVTTLYLFPIFLFSQIAKPNFEWVTTNGGSGSDMYDDLEIDSLGNVYTLGRFRGVVDLDPGSGVDTHISKGYSDIFVQKLDSLGNLIWAKTFGGYTQLFEMGRDLHIDNNGDILICGVFDSIVDFDPGVGVHDKASLGIFDSFVLKLDSQGEFKWVYHLGSSTSYSNGFSLLTDANNNVIVSGYYNGVLDFDSGSGQSNKNSYNNDNAYILKLSSNGEYIWAKEIGGNQFFTADVDILYSGIDDNSQLYFVGWYRQDCDFKPGTGVYYKTSTDWSTYDVFILSTDSNGVFNWVKTLNGVTPAKPKSFLIDNAGDLYISGFYQNSIDLNPGTANHIVTSIGAADGFIVKLNNQGEHLWSISQGCAKADDMITSLDIDSDNNVFGVGTFYGDIDVDPGSSVFELSSPYGGIYVQKLNESGNFLWAEKIDVGSFGNYLAYFIKVEESGNLYVSGRFEGAVDFNFGANPNYQSSNGLEDVFVTKWSQHIPLSVHNHQMVDDFSMYPIPTTENLFIEFTTEELYTVRIYNGIGALVMSKSAHTSKMELDLKSITSGVYTIHVLSKGEIFRKQIIKF